jgi:hypothetical protein
MFKSCIQIHDHHEDGSRMRPSGSSDMMEHWAWRLAYGYLGTGEVAIAGSEDDVGIEVWIGRRFWETNPHAFDHIMRFIKINNLSVTVDADECMKCSGRESCVSHNGKAKTTSNHLLGTM